MPSPNGKIIAVSKRFSELLCNGHKKVNSSLGVRMNKKMTFIDYTDFLADILGNDFDIILSRGMITPIKRGRKAKTVKLNFKPNRNFPF